MNYALIFAVIVLFCGVALCAPPSDMTRNVTEMIQARGYPVEDHYVITSDGFVLSMQRITGGRGSFGTPNANKPVVLLQHGLEDNSITWVVQAVVNESLGFILADAGYDVWLSNVRGNTYSMGNIHYQPTTTQFWDWSADEMAHIDLPAFIQYILQVTGVSKIGYVGHSQGTMMGFIAFENPKISQYVNLFVALAPVAYVHHTKAILLPVLADLDVAGILALFGEKDFLPDTTLLQKLLPGVCKDFPSLCDNLLGLLMGWDTTNLNNTRLPVIVAHEPSGTSVHNMIHWSQLVKKNVFQAYDYGSAGNMQHYNSTVPTQYDVSLINIPVAAYWGGNDDLADPADVAQILPLIKNLVMNHTEPTYCHTDFVWGENANVDIYASVLNLLNKYKTL